MLLDVGTGAGHLLGLLGAQATRAVGVDISSDALRLARTNVHGAGLSHCELQRGDMYDLPFAGPLFDTVTVDRILATAQRPARGAQRDRSHVEARRARRRHRRLRCAAAPRARRIRSRRCANGSRAPGSNARACIRSTPNDATCWSRSRGASRSRSRQRDTASELRSSMTVEQIKDRIGDAAEPAARTADGVVRVLPAEGRGRWSRRCGTSVQRLTPLQPRFVSVTYGADGSTRARTHNIVTRIQQIHVADGRAASHVRRRTARGDPGYRAQLLGSTAFVTSSRCAAIRRRAAASTCRIRTASPTRSIW